ncbi:MAG: phenylalanine--tRNA ligase subunit alpha [Methanomassiliicoccales archaeon]|jgi:phenylalanyl-tRNA synthetase alpha chain|nr:phenylalanine--tRNA ligase subunit alpha [Methanomassiliicoccales archaeon]
MEIPEIVESLSPNEKRVLIALKDLGGIGTPDDVLKKGNFRQPVEVMNAASWLQSKGLVRIEERAKKVYSLKNQKIIEEGLPERRAINAIHSRGGVIDTRELEEVLDKEDIPIAIGWLKRKGLVNVKKDCSKTLLELTDQGKETVSSDMEDERILKMLRDRDIIEGEVDKKVIEQLKSRQNLINERLVVERKLALTELGSRIASQGLEAKEEVGQITPELLQTGRWRDVTLRKYDIRTYAPSTYPGKKHPITRMASEVRRIFIQMGFEEIDDEYVQAAFWNMDALFTPQDHPARDLQDTFYLKNPARIELEDDELVKRVKEIHETGGWTGSTGWRYNWRREEAEKALLRTHTTVATIRYLARNPDPPIKVFSISRIFRNEAIDATHLPEFMQIEGIVVEEDANFDMLCGILKEFYRRMGFEKLRFRPGYFPYTEPSLEVEVFHNGKWMELGGAGIFRPEVTAPFGVKHNVLAWGLGFERIAMLRWNLTDIRELYISDIDLLRKSPIF